MRTKQKHKLTNKRKIISTKCLCKLRKLSKFIALLKTSKFIRTCNPTKHLFGLFFDSYLGKSVKNDLSNL